MIHASLSSKPSYGWYQVKRYLWVDYEVKKKKNGTRKCMEVTPAVTVALWDKFGCVLSAMVMHCNHLCAETTEFLSGRNNSVSQSILNWVNWGESLGCADNSGNPR